MEDKTVLAQQTLTASANGAEFETPSDTRGAIFYIRTSNVTGTTPTCTVKLQQKEPISGTWVDIVGATTAAITAAGITTLEVYPGVVAVANRKVNGLLGKTIRAVATIGGTTPSFRLSISANFFK